MSKITISPVFHAKKKRNYVAAPKNMNLITVIQRCLTYSKFEDFFLENKLKHDDNLIEFQHQTWAMGVIFYHQLVTKNEEKKILDKFIDRFENYILKHNPLLK